MSLPPIITYDWLGLSLGLGYIEFCAYFQCCPYTFDKNIAVVEKPYYLHMLLHTETTKI